MKSSGDLAHLGRTTLCTLSLEICRRPRSKSDQIKIWRVNKEHKGEVLKKITYQLTILVLQKFREVEELWDELLDIVGVVHEGLPRRWDGVELAVGAVKPETSQHV